MKLLYLGIKTKGFSGQKSVQNYELTFLRNNGHDITLIELSRIDFISDLMRVIFEDIRSCFHFFAYRTKIDAVVINGGFSRLFVFRSFCYMFAPKVYYQMHVTMNRKRFLHNIYNLILGNRITYILLNEAQIKMIPRKAAYTMRYNYVDTFPISEGSRDLLYMSIACKEKGWFDVVDLLLECSSLSGDIASKYQPIGNYVGDDKEKFAVLKQRLSSRQGVTVYSKGIFDSNKDRVLGRNKVLAFLSRFNYESMPMAVLEALSSAMYVVAYKNDVLITRFADAPGVYFVNDIKEAKELIIELTNDWEPNILGRNWVNKKCGKDQFIVVYE